VRAPRSLAALGGLLLGTALACRLGSPLATPTPAIPPTPTPAPTARATSVPVPPDPTATLADQDLIHEQVSTIRGLYPTGPLERELLAPDQIRQNVEEDFLAEYTPEEAADDVQVLAALGLLDPEFDLLSFYLDFYEEQVAGYYDTELEKMYVVGAGWGGAERLTYAHEYVHALQDQVYDLEQGLGYTDEGCQADPERCSAISALIEGDASLAEEQWWQAYSTPEDYEDLVAAIDAYTGDVFNAAPAYLQQDFLFPYEQGLEFVRSLFRQGGWAAVDEAYLDPPSTTEEILHPELYGKEEPLPVELPDLTETLGAGWEQLEVGRLGEWFTYLVLDEEIPDWEAKGAAAGWGGDAYQVYRDEAGDRTALVLLTRWDSPRDAHEFAEAFGTYAGWRFGEAFTEQPERRWTWERGAVLLERAYDQSLWIVAPDEAAQQALREAIEFPAR
jgi:hypothetical protein